MQVTPLFSLDGLQYLFYLLFIYLSIHLLLNECRQVTDLIVSKRSTRALAATQRSIQWVQRLIPRG